MSITNKLRKKLIDISGYWFYKRKHLPIGADFVEDLRKLNLSVETIFDVGANYGQTALYYAENFPNSKIYSFEPIEKPYKKLVKETKHLKNVFCFPNAFGDTNDTIEISLFDENQSQLNSLKHNNTNLNSNAVKEQITVKTLDSFLQEQDIQTIDLLKIDTEGYEIEVLKGALNSLKSGKIKLILCEAALSFANERNTQLVNIINFLKPYNFTLLGMYETNINYLNQGLAYSNILFVKI